jgi:tetratricopeptide (TPR) repeat protein
MNLRTSPIPRRLFAFATAIAVSLELGICQTGRSQVAESGPETASAQTVNQTQSEAGQLFSDALKLLRANRAFEARQLLERAAKLEPGSAGIRCNLGLSYQNSGNLDRALAEFQNALKIQPNMPAATLNMAGCYQSMGQSQTAIEWFQRYLRLRPTPPDANQVQDIIAAITAISKKPGADPTLPDYLLSITADGTYRWPAHKLPIKVFISSGNGIDGFQNSFSRALIEAFDSWSTASGNRLAYTLVGDRAQADVACDWTSNPIEVSKAATQSERGITEVVANPDNEIQRATIKILTKPMLDEGILSDDDMKKACLHEVGHVLGLQGHSMNNHDVMFFTIDTSTVWPVLTKRDKATIAKLYELYPVWQFQPTQ